MQQDFRVYFATLGIAFYRRFLSPYKGYACPHRLLHGEESCSAFVGRTLLECGWHEAQPAIRQRFSQCKSAALMLRRRNDPLHLRFAQNPLQHDSPPSLPPKPRGRWNNKRRGCDSNDCTLDVCSIADLATLPLRCFSWSGKGFGQGFDACFDCGPMDSGCIDCNPCDGCSFP